jgi:hypothetical protein
VDQREEPCEVPHYAWTRQGPEGLLGHQVCQGPDAWPQGEGSIQSLDPEGCLVRRLRAMDTTTNEDTDAGNNDTSRPRCHTQTSAKKCKRVGKGAVLPLDKSLLMGVLT